MSSAPVAELDDLVADRCTRAVKPAIGSFAQALCDRHGAGVKAVVAYGSCLRDVTLSESLVDLYLLVDDYAHVHRRAWERIGNALLPPNVYYLEHTFEGAVLRAKYAVVSLAQFERKLSAATANPYFWARFAQPCVLVRAADEEVRTRVLAALAGAVRTFLAETESLAGPAPTPQGRWTAGLAATYATELRSEGTARAAGIVAADRDHYAALAHAFERERAGGPPAPRRNWLARRIAGKLLSVARLVKAGFTFQGGADYIAWKIERHSGVHVDVKPWHRRHPILAAIVMAPRLYLRGGFR